MFVDNFKPQIVWRGYSYYLFKNVLNWQQVEANLYKGEVTNLKDKIYKVQIDIKDPLKSTCTCPYASTKDDLCKHMVALDFTIFPDSSMLFHEIVMKHMMTRKIVDDMRKQRYQEIEKYVAGLSDEMTRILLVEVLFELEESLV